MSNLIVSSEEHFTVCNEEVELKLLEGQLASIQELSFAFKRAASRLNEMASANWGRE
jgi:predicted ATPase